MTPSTAPLPDLSEEEIAHYKSMAMLATQTTKVGAEALMFPWADFARALSELKRRRESAAKHDEFYGWLASVLENPPEPNEALVELMRRAPSWPTPPAREEE